MNLVHPRKLLLSKWTAVRPVAKEKHFLVTKIILPDSPDEKVDAHVNAKVEWVEIEAAYSKVKRRIAWRELRDAAIWRRGWL